MFLSEHDVISLFEARKLICIKGEKNVVYQGLALLHCTGYLRPVHPSGPTHQSHAITYIPGIARLALAHHSPQRMLQ